MHKSIVPVNFIQGSGVGVKSNEQCLLALLLCVNETGSYLDVEEVIDYNISIAAGVTD